MGSTAPGMSKGSEGEHMDIAEEARLFLKRISQAEERAADLRARAAEIEREMLFPLSVGVANMEAGRGKGPYKSSVEAKAIKRERQEAKRAALLHEAEQVEQEKAYVTGFVEMLKRSTYFMEGKILEYRFLMGWSRKRTAEKTRWSLARVKELEQRGLMSIGAVFLGLVEPGAYYDGGGLFRMGAEECKKVLKDWGRK